MAAGATDVVVKFLADISELKDGVQKIGSQTDKLGTTFKRLGGLIGGAFAVREIGDFINAAEEADATNRKLEQTLRLAGDATGQWAKHAEDLANTLQYKTGIDDETIKNGQAILATFHDLSGATGQASGAFDRATKAALDLSKAGFGDVSSTATMLGKALEDPQRGLTALRRVGVTFTADQEKLIKSLAASGDQAGAMNEILKAVEGQVGGTAEKTVTAGDKMKVAWDETKESLGKALLPVMEKLTPMVGDLAGFVQKNADWLVPFALGIAAVVLGVKAWIGAQTILNAVLATFGAEETVVLGPLLLIVFALGLAVAAVVLLYQKWDQVWNWIANLPAWAKILLLLAVITNPVSLLILIVATLGVYWTNIWGVIAKVTGWVWDNVLSKVFGFIKGAVGDMITAAVFLWKIWVIVWGALSDAVSKAWGIIDRTVGWIADRIDQVLGPLEKLAGVVGKVGGALGLGNTLEGRTAVPALAEGGIVTRPTLAMIGERGPEAVVPLGSGGGGVGSTIVVNVTTTGLGADNPAIQRAVVAALRCYVGTNGPLTGIAG